MTPEGISSNATTSSAASASKLATETDPIADTVNPSGIGSELQQQANETAHVFSTVFKEICQARLQKVSGKSVLSLVQVLRSDVNPHLSAVKARLLQSFKASLQTSGDPSGDGGADPSSLQGMTYAFILGTAMEALDTLMDEYTERITTALESLEGPDAADRLEEIMAKLLKSGDDQVEAPPCA